MKKEKEKEKKENKPIYTNRISFAIHAFEDVRTWLTIFGSHSIHFLILYAILCFFSVMFSRMSSIALGAPGDIRAIVKC